MKISRIVLTLFAIGVLARPALSEETSDVTDVAVEDRAAFVSAVTASVHAYIEAYNVPDTDRKDELVLSSFSKTGSLFTPTRKMDIDGLLEMVSEFHDEATLEIIGDINVHHRFVYFRWKMVELADGAVYTGTDYCDVAEDGRLSRVVIFFD